MQIYKDYLIQLTKLLEDLANADSESMDYVETLEAISEVAGDLSLDAYDDAKKLGERLDNEALTSELEQAEAYRGQY